MTDDQVRAMVKAMQDADEPHEKIQEAINLAMRAPKPARTAEELAANDRPLIHEDPVGTALGMAAGGGAAKLALGRLMPMVSTRLGRVAAGTAASGLGNAAGSAVEDVARGETSPFEVGRHAVDATALGMLFGVPFSMLGEAGRAIVGSRGGQARRLIEQHGGTVGPTTAGEGGTLGTELAGLEPNDRGIGEASRRSAAKILKDLEEKYFSETARPHAARKAEITALTGGDKVDATPIYSDLVRLRESERLTPGERTTIDSVLKRMEKHLTPVGEDGAGIHMTEEQLNDFRGMLQDLSKTGSPHQATVAQSKLQRVAHTTKEAVDEGPYATTNKQFREGKKRYQESRQMLDLPAEPAHSLDPARAAPEGGSEPEIAKVANMLARDEQESVTAGVRNADRVARFREMHPEHADTLDWPDLLRAKSDLQFKLSSGAAHGGLLSRLKNEGVPLAVTGLLAEQMTHNPAQAAGIAAGLHLLRANASPIAGRLLYRPAQLATGALPPAIPPFMWPMLSQPAQESRKE